ncbi:MAG TPA: radical SAM protein [Candidatus Nanoarchaeia archaeon]|nr:radical SAM protein [Candidatus Nanoarchaeia archaeon]
MNILFINPTPGHGFLVDNIKRKRIAGLFPPLGIASLATVLENGGYNCKVIDLFITPLTKEQLLYEVKEFKTDIVCISILTSQAPEAYTIAKVLKSSFTIPIICGGSHASIFAEKILEDIKEIDYIIFGEGEYKLLNLVNAITANTSISMVRGIYYREKEVVTKTENDIMITDLDTLPIPLRKFFDIDKYIPVPNQYKRLPTINMITSRGCTYRMCKFCNESSFMHTTYRRNSVSRVIEEIKYLIKQYGVREIYFFDDEFVLDKEWILNFCDALHTENLDLTWTCYAKVNFVTLELLKKMASVGCWGISYGIESANQELLNSLQKGQSLFQIRNAVHWAHEAGIEVKGSFMLGLPGETPEMGKKTIDFAIELDVDYPIFTLTTPYPGTKLYEDFVAEGNVDFDYSHYTSLFPIYLSKGYNSREELVKLQKEAYRRCYLRLGFFKRKLARIKNGEDIQRYLKGMYFFLKMNVMDMRRL